MNPLRLPEAVKRPMRALRDAPLVNDLGARLARAVVPKRHLWWWQKRLPKIGDVRASLPDGTPMNLHSDVAESVHTSIFYAGWTGAEPEVLPLWKAEAERAQVIVDVGAHIGHLSIVAGLSNKRAALHCVEPHPAVRALLRRNLDLNGLAERAKVHDCAFGRQAGTAAFFIADVDVPSSSSLSEDFMNFSSENAPQSFPVDVRVLDDEIAPTTGPALMKIDTESTEADVLAGASRFIRAAKPVIFIEVLHHYDTSAAINAVLNEIGVAYDAYLLTDSGPVAKPQIEADPHWRNYMLRPRD